MQPKFSRQKSIGQSLVKKLINIVIISLVVALGIFLLDKVDFPSPQQKIDQDITNEIIKLK
tara:strand:- start:120 stop:302 length:183 start_codon:yes stop_codon:yes gene_type:complete